jgi:hypothetical protein
MQHFFVPVSLRYSTATEETATQHTTGAQRSESAQADDTDQSDQSAELTRHRILEAALHHVVLVQLA